MDKPTADTLSFSLDAFKMTTYLDDYIVRGNVYTITLAAAAVAATPVYFTSEILEAVQDDVNAAFLLPVALNPTAGYATLKIYEDTDYTGGTALTAVNRNRTAGNGSKSTVKQGATGSDKGALLFTFIYGSAGLPQGGGGGAGTAANSIVIDKTKRYLYELENSADGTVGIVAEFAEI